MAIVTGGGSGIGLATAHELSGRGARVAVLDLDVAAVDRPLLAFALRRHRRRRRRRRGGNRRRRARWHRRRRRQCRHRRPGHRRRQRRRGVAAPARCQRARRRPHRPRRLAVPAPVLGRCRRRDRVDRVVGGSAPTGALLGVEGSAGGADAGDGRRPRSRGDPRQRRGARYCRHAVGRAPPRRHRRSDSRAGGARGARQPIGRMVSPEEVAWAICYLASPRSASTTGTILAVDGGMYGLRLRPPS